MKSNIILKYLINDSSPVRVLLGNRRVKSGIRIRSSFLQVIFFLRKFFKWGRVVTTCFLLGLFYLLFICVYMCSIACMCICLGISGFWGKKGIL